MKRQQDCIRMFESLLCGNIFSCRDLLVDKQQEYKMFPERKMLSEALVAFHLPSEIDNVGLGTFVAKIRNENRNGSAHFGREPNDLKSFYGAASNTF
jgi:hypothetical protein